MMAIPPEYYLAQSLTRQEWLTVYAFMLTAEYTNSYGAEGMSSSEREKVFSTLHNGMRWAIRELADRRFQFKGIELDRHNRLQFTIHEPLCKENVLFVEKIATGKLVSPILAVRTALEEFEKQGVWFDFAPMQEFLSQAMNDLAIANTEEDSDPEFQAETGKWIQEQLAMARDILLGLRKEVN